MIKVRIWKEISQFVNFIYADVAWLGFADADRRFSLLPQIENQIKLIDRLSSYLTSPSKNSNTIRIFQHSTPTCNDKVLAKVQSVHEYIIYFSIKMVQSFFNKIHFGNDFFSNSILKRHKKIIDGIWTLALNTWYCKNSIVFQFKVFEFKKIE